MVNQLTTEGFFLLAARCRGVNGRAATGDPKPRRPPPWRNEEEAAQECKGPVGPGWAVRFPRTRSTKTGARCGRTSQEKTSDACRYGGYPRHRLVSVG